MPDAQVPDAQVLDARGLVVAPGFVDVHSHADNAPLLETPDTSKILQGVTTEVVGNCGMTLAPRDLEHAEDLERYAARLFPPFDWTWCTFADLLRATDTRGYVTNYAPLVGHNAVRIGTLGMADRPPDAAELTAMRSSVDEALEAGAFGLSTGLIYPPGLFSATEEVVALAEVLPSGRPYVSHIRGESHQVLDSIREALAIGEAANRPVHISHLKVAGRDNWGTMGAALALIDDARRRGVDVRQDVYPYSAASTMLAAALPPWFQDGGDDAVLTRLHDPDQLDRLRRDLDRPGDGWENFILGAGWDGVVVASSNSHRFDGMSIAQIADDRDLEPFGAYVDLLIGEGLRGSMVIHSMNEADLERAMAHPGTMVGSDGLPPGTGGRPHPRLHGTFPRVLRRYTAERAVLTVSEAIRRMTSLPADSFAIPDRGRITDGAAADLVVLDPALVGDRATYDEPTRPPEGVAWVLVNGTVVVDHGRFLGPKAGRRLTPAN